MVNTTFEKFLLELSRRFYEEPKLRSLGNGLGLREFEIGSIKYDNLSKNGITTAANAMLYKWLQRQGTTEESELLQKLRKVCSGIEMINAFAEVQEEIYGKPNASAQRLESDQGQPTLNPAIVGHDEVDLL